MHGATETASDTVVMKFGGTSVGDPERIRGVARRLVEARERGVRVVGTVSAMGRTTDSLLELAGRVSPHPDPRELDMLLSTGERIACALVAMAVHDLGHEAVSFTGSQAGIITDAVYTRAKIREITPVRVLDALPLAGDRPVHITHELTPARRALLRAGMIDAVINQNLRLASREVLALALDHFGRKVASGDDGEAPFEVFLRENC